MKLQIEGAEPKDIVKVSLMQDGADINIIVNKTLIAYMVAETGKIQLELVAIPPTERTNFILDERNCVKVR